MTHYSVYLNYWNSRVRVHKEGCSFAVRHGVGTKETAGWWEDFDSLEEAKAEMKKAADWCHTDDYGPCAHCAPF